jgi:predicted nucleic acid-binding protein
MIALVDSDVLLDLGFPREPFAEEAAQLLEWCRLHTGRGFLAWHSLGNVHYLLARHHDDALRCRSPVRGSSYRKFGADEDP